MNQMSLQQRALKVFVPPVDRVTFEILKHRLWQINEEQGTTIKRASGSPIASEAQDFNVGMANAAGQLVCCGMFLIAHVTGLSSVIRNCIATIGLDNIHPGDMFITNDPWLGAIHQNDVALVAPLHWEGELIGWTGSVIHQSDVGGPVSGSWNLDATDTFQEAPRYRFLRIVSAGRTAPEVIDTLKTNSRLPHSVELDLRAQISAANVVRERTDVICRKYGAKVVTAVMDGCLDNTEIMLRRRLLDIPDGVWAAENHVDHDGHEDNVTTIRVRLTKRADSLIFDYRDSDPQARGLINCSKATLVSAPFTVVLTSLCESIPWNEGVMRLVTVGSRPGTVVDAEFPSPVASGNVNAAWSATNAAQVVVSRMLLRSQNHRHYAMGVWAGAPLSVNIFGRTTGGEAFGTLLGLTSLQGAGARTFADGYDVAGYLFATRSGAMNVETAEARYPMLHLFRRLTRDSGGPGEFRGGLSAQTAFTPHGIDCFEVIVSAFGSDASGSAGIAGGLPGGGGNTLLTSGFDLEGTLEGAQLDDVPSGQLLPIKTRFSLARGEMLTCIPHGGGGYGDPLDRDPHAVAGDVAEGVVSEESAQRIYRVLLDAAGQPDIEATGLARNAARRHRLDTARLNRPADGFDPFARAGGPYHGCVRCKTPLDIDAALPIVDEDLGAAGPYLAMRHAGKSARFSLRTIVCPKCGSALDAVQVRLAEATQ